MTDAKNSSDIGQTERFQCEAQYDMDWERFVALDRIAKIEPVLAALDHAKKVNGTDYPHDWYPNYLNTLHKEIRKHNKIIWMQKLQNRKCGEGDVSMNPV